MVFLNYSTMQMVAKIVYYGPGLCGKTTNLKEIYKKTSPRSRGEMVSLETETDRTLFFDLLPMDVGVVGGFKTKFQLYTVPGQVFYNATRKLVLRGVDGIVFVADSQKPMLEANRNSYENLLENLKELDVDIADVPLVFQFNKRDLPNCASVEELNQALNNVRRPYVEAAALKGLGVFETLKEISKQTLVKLRAKAMEDLGEEPESEPAPVQEEPPAQESDSGEIAFKVREPKPVEEKSISTAELLEEDAMPDDVSFDEFGDDPADESGLPDVTSDLAEDPTIGEIDDLDDDLTDFDLDFSEDDEIDDDSITLDEFDDSLETTLDHSTPASIDDTQPGQENASPPTVHLDIPLDLDDAEEQEAEPVAFGDVPVMVDGDETLDDATVRMTSEEMAEHREAIGLGGPASEDSSEATTLELPDEEPALEESVLEEPVAEEPAPVEVKPAAKPRPKKSAAKLSSSLEELESLATQTVTPKTRKPGRGRKSEEVDSLLGHLVASPAAPKPKADKFKIKVPGGFTRAQMNCVFLDENDNVVHTQLVKVNHQDMGNGKRRIRMILDVESDEE